MKKVIVFFALIGMILAAAAFRFFPGLAEASEQAAWQISLERDGNGIFVHSDNDGSGSTFVAQYKEGRLKSVDKLEPSDSVIAKISGVDQIKGLLWDTESLQPLSEPAVISGSDEKEFINAGIANSYTVRFSGISGERCVGVIVYREDTGIDKLPNEDTAGEVVYFDEIPAPNHKYSGEYTFEGKSGLYRLAVSDFTGMALENRLVLYADVNENAAAVAELMAAAKRSEEEMKELGRQKRYELLFYLPDTDSAADAAALKEVYSYISGSAGDAADGKILAEIYRRYASENK